MSVNLSLFAGAGAQFFDDNGVPLAGGLIYTYAAGTTSPLATYTSSSGTTALPNPIVLNAAGRVPTGEIWVTAGVTYKFVVYTSANVLVASYDNINGTYIATDLADTLNPNNGDALVGFRQSNSSGNLPNAVGRTVHKKLQETVSVKDFGAVGDGVTDDTTAFFAWATALVANNVAGYIPSGKYIIKNKIIFTSQVSLYGDAGTTQLIWPSSAVAAGFEINLTTTDAIQYVYVEGLTFIRNGARASGTALHIDGSAQISGTFIQPRTYARVILNSVVATGNSNSTSSWEIGIHLESVIGAKLQEIDVFGSYTTSPATLDDCTGILCDGIGSPVETTVVGLRVYTTKYAVDILDWEGVYLLSPTLVQVETGVRWQSTSSSGNKPHLEINGGHISSQLYGVQAIGLSQGTIKNILFYSRGATEAKTGATHILLDSGLFNRVGDCTFSGTTHDGIVCTNSEQGTYITSNVWQSVKNGIQLNESSNYIIVDRQNFFLVTSTITNLGIANYIPNSNAIVRINAVQSIPNATFTKISFTNVNNTSAPEYWNIANPTRLVAPRGGIYDIKCAITFALNATGVRQVRLLLNGTPVTAPQTLTTLGATTGSETVLNCVFPSILIGIGSYVEIEVYQNSGSNVDVAVNSWAQINWVKV